MCRASFLRLLTLFAQLSTTLTLTYTFSHSIPFFSLHFRTINPFIHSSSTSVHTMSESKATQDEKKHLYTIVGKTTSKNDA